MGMRETFLTLHTLIQYFLSFRFFNLVPSINFELSCLNHNPSSDSQRSAAEMDEWRDSSRRGHDRVRNIDIDKADVRFELSSTFLLGTNFNSRNVQLSNNK